MAKAKAQPQGLVAAVGMNVGPDEVRYEAGDIVSMEHVEPWMLEDGAVFDPSDVDAEPDPEPESTATTDTAFTTGTSGDSDPLTSDPVVNDATVTTVESEAS